ncbi:MAG TPA: hypothetical protein VGN72_10120 [Tepidisphaeraceae bacterium]|jgi:hypothetical protein|nr:hypothetical protein [Tepidisphaeraceae bacterium]
MLTPEEIDALPDYTPAQELKLYRHIRRRIAEGGQAIGHTGKQWQQVDLKALDAIIKDLEEKVAANPPAEEAYIDPSIELAMFGRPR